jgi:hypothetical protein
MRRIVLAAALAATGFLGSCGIAGERPEGYEKRDFIVDPGIRFRPTSLREIVGNPQQDAEVKFDALLNKRDETIWQAYYTPFRPGEFKSFSVWPIDAAVWDPRGRGRSIATLYVAADSPEIADLYAMERYTPVRISGVVKSTFDSRPWIQVHYVEEIDAPWFSEESLGHLIRGMDAARANAGQAMSLLDDALDGPLSPAGQAAAWKAKGHIHLAQKQYSEAESCYTHALEAMPGDRAAVDGLRRAKRKAAPGEWTEEEEAKEAAGSVNWKAMYTELHAEHGTTCKTLAEEHARCGEMAMTMTAQRDEAVKAHAECGAGAEGMKKQLEEKDAALKASAEKTTALEAERDELKKKVEGGGADAETARKQIEEKDAALKASAEKTAALEAERDELKKKVEGGGADAEAARKQVEEKDAAIKAANEKVTALEAERDELKKRAEAGGDPDALKKQIEAKDAEIKTAQSKVGELEQNVKDRDETIKKQREEIDRLTEELKKKESGN